MPTATCYSDAPLYTLTLREILLRMTVYVHRWLHVYIIYGTCTCMCNMLQVPGVCSRGDSLPHRHLPRCLQLLILSLQFADAHNTNLLVLTERRVWWTVCHSSWGTTRQLAYVPEGRRQVSMCCHIWHRQWHQHKSLQLLNHRLSIYGFTMRVQ